MKKKILQINKITLIFLSTILILISCDRKTEIIEDDPDLSGINKDPDQPSASNEAKIILYMKVPGKYALPETRALSHKQEEAIGDLSRLNILVFEETPSGEKFAYRAKVTDRDDIQNKFTVELVKNEDTNKKYRIVVMANCTIANEVLLVGSEKNELLSKVTFDLPDKWNVDGESATPTFTHLPMWGEIAHTISITESTPSQSVNLLRAVARIDVGLKYTNPTAQDDENVTGFDNFKLTSVRVYRTASKGLVAPSSANLSGAGVTAPSLSNDTPIRDDNQPLLYENITDEKSLIRNIYVPEVSGTNLESLNRHCVVLGGRYGGSTTESFYRVNFEAGSTEFVSLLRNHHYRINVQSVTGPGHSLPENALNSIPANITVTVIPWNDQVVDMHVSGSYHFGVTERTATVTFEKESQTRIHFDTNLPDNFERKIVWDNPAQTDFEFFDLDKTGVSIKSTEVNGGQIPITQGFTLTAGSFTIKMTAEQLHRANFFSIECEETHLSGLVLKGEALGPNHKITVTLRTFPGEISQSLYPVSLATDEIDGIKYVGEGTFQTGDTEIQVDLIGQGVTQSTKPKDFTVKVLNEGVYSSCHVRVRPAYKEKHILTVNGDPNNAWGFGPASPSICSKILRNVKNYGTDAESVIPIENLTIETIYTHEIATRLGPGKSMPDIIITSYDVVLDGPAGLAAANAIEDYVKAGGVLIYLYQEIRVNNFNLLLHLMDEPSITLASQLPHNIGSDNDALYLKNVNDEILNGPFGNAMGKHWGQDAGYTLRLLVPEDKVIVYSEGGGINDINPTSIEGYSMFRLKDHHVFWVGDAGFAAAFIGSGPTVYPAGAEADPTNPGFYIPVPKKNYSKGPKTASVYNSIIFCNVIAWGLEEAEHNGINSNNP